MMLAHTGTIACFVVSLSQEWLVKISRLCDHLRECFLFKFTTALVWRTPNQDYGWR